MQTDISSKKLSLNQNKSFLKIVIAIILLAIIIFLLNHSVDGKFLTMTNISVIISHSIYPAFIAWGFCFLFACNYTDLSVGSVLVLGAFMTSLLGNQFGYIGVVIGGVVTGIILVCINFCVFVYTKIPSWIAGISMAMIYEAVAIFLLNFTATKKYMSAPLNRDYRLLGQLPYSLIMLFIGLIIAYIIYNRTTIGLNIRAIGSNAEVAKALGINVSKTLLKVGLISGLFIGFACFLQESYIGTMTVKSGLTSLYLVFQPIAAFLLAQILQKKINIIIAVPICSMIIYAIFNMLTILGVPSGTIQEAALGAFVIIFGIIGQRGAKGVVK